MAQQTKTRSERVTEYEQMTRSSLAEAADQAQRTAEWADENGERALYELSLERLAAMDEALPEGETAGDVAQEVGA